MSIQSEINRISGNVADALTAIANKGVTIPAGSSSDDLATLIGQIQTGGGGAGAISIVDTPDSAGGTVRTITAVDISSDTVTAAHLETGYTAHDAEGNPITGTLSPGGGGGLEYEEGTYSPSSDVAHPTISFAKTHTSRPFFVLIVDSSGTVPTADSIYMWTINSWYDLMGVEIAISSSQMNYARTLYLYKTSGNFSSSGNNVSSLTGTANTCMPYYLTESGFTPYAGSTSRYFRNGITYKWFAVWKPET